MIAALPLALAALGPIDPGLAERRAAQILADDRYSFCHDPTYNLTDAEAAFCPPVAPEPNPRCPRMHEACKAPRAYLDLNIPMRLQQTREAEDGEPAGDRDASEGRPAKKAKKAGGAGEDEDDGTRSEPRRRVLREREPILPALGGLAEILFWVVLIAAAVAIILAIVRASLNRRRDETGDERPEPAAAPLASPAAEGHAEVLRDVAALLERARAAARAGDFAGGIKAAHAALLFRLDRDGLIRVEPSRTNGDHVRDLAPQPELRAQVRDVVRDVEQVQFGSAAPDSSLFERIFARAAAIAGRAGPALLLFALLSGCPVGKPAPWGDSPSGANALIELAKTYHIEAGFRARRLTKLEEGDEGPSTLVLFHDIEAPTEEVWRRVRDWVRSGRHLILAGAPLPGWVDARYGLASGDEARLDPGPEAHEMPLLGDLRGFVSPDPQSVEAPEFGWSKLVVRRGGGVYAAQHKEGEGLVTVLADDRIFTNVGLTVGDNPALVIALLSLAEGRVELVDGLLDWGADNPAQAVQQMKLTPVVLQLLLLALVFYLWRGVRFGRPRDPVARSRRRFSEHVQALGLHYARARATRHAAAQYAAWALDRLRDRVHTGGASGLYGVAQALAGRTGDDETKIYQVLLEATSLREGAAGESQARGRRSEASAGDLKLMQELARLLRAAGGHT